MTEPLRPKLPAGFIGAAHQAESALPHYSPPFDEATQKQIGDIFIFLQTMMPSERDPIEAKRIPPQNQPNSDHISPQVLNVVHEIQNVVQKILNIDQRSSIKDSSIAFHQALNCMNSRESFKNISQDMCKVISQIAPQSYEKLVVFTKTNKTAFKKLKQMGWEGLKHDLGSKMTDKSMDYEKLRSETVKMITDLSLEVLEKAGYNATFNDVGTPGYNSDIDIGLIPSTSGPKTPHSAQVLEKSLVDMITFHIFESLPGELLDTESYTQHPGESLQTGSKLQTTEGNEEFSKLEITAATMQMMKQKGGLESKDWKNYKNSIIKHIGEDKDLKKAYEDIFNEVESHFTQTQKELRQYMDDIKILKGDQEKPEVQKLAMMGFKQHKLLQYSQEMDKCERKIIIIRQNLKDMLTNLESLTKRVLKSQTDANLEVSNLDEEAETMTSLEKSSPRSKEFQERQLHACKMEIDFLNLEIAKKGLLRTEFYDEGYLTQGAFKEIVNQGQVFQRHDENYREEREASMDNPSEWSGAYKLPTAVKEITVLDNASSSLENLAYLDNKFQTHINAKEGLSDAEIAISKYSDRNTQSNLNLIKKIISKLPEDDPNLGKLHDLEKKMEGLHEKASHLEKLKRGRFLPQPAAVKAICKILGNDIKEDKIIASLDQIDKMTQNDVSILPKEKLFMLLTHLNDQGLIDLNNLPEKTDPYDIKGDLNEEGKKIKEVIDVLKAYCGFSPKDNPDLIDIHKNAKEVMLTIMGLTSSKDIKELNESIEDLSLQVHVLSIKTGVVALPRGREILHEQIQSPRQSN